MKKVVIVGVGELVQQVPEDLNTAFSPLDFMERAARMALKDTGCLLYTSPSPRDATLSRMPSSA